MDTQFQMELALFALQIVNNVCLKIILLHVFNVISDIHLIKVKMYALHVKCSV
jgi:hypothetical protein